MELNPVQRCIIKHIAAITDAEAEIEETRCGLASIPYFDPTAVFERLDSSKTGSLTGKELFSFLMEWDPSVTEDEIAALFVRFGEESIRNNEIRLADFINTVLPQDPILRNLALARANVNPRLVPTTDVMKTLCFLLFQEVETYKVLETRRAKVEQFPGFDISQAYHFLNVNNHPQGISREALLTRFRALRPDVQGVDVLGPLFRRFDVDCDGYLSFTELMDLLLPPETVVDLLEQGLTTPMPFREEAPLLSAGQAAGVGAQAAQAAGAASIQGAVNNIAASPATGHMQTASRLSPSRGVNVNVRRAESGATEIHISTTMNAQSEMAGSRLVTCPPLSVSPRIVEPSGIGASERPAVSMLVEGSSNQAPSVASHQPTNPLMQSHASHVSNQQQQMTASHASVQQFNLANSQHHTVSQHVASQHAASQHAASQHAASQLTVSHQVASQKPSYAAAAPQQVITIEMEAPSSRPSLRQLPSGRPTGAEDIPSRCDSPTSLYASQRDGRPASTPSEAPLDSTQGVLHASQINVQTNENFFTRAAPQTTHLNEPEGGQRLGPRKSLTMLNATVSPKRRIEFQEAQLQQLEQQRAASPNGCRSPARPAALMQSEKDLVVAGTTAPGCVSPTYAEVAKLRAKLERISLRSGVDANLYSELLTRETERAEAEARQRHEEVMRQAYEQEREQRQFMESMASKLNTAIDTPLNIPPRDPNLPSAPVPAFHPSAKLDEYLQSNEEAKRQLEMQQRANILPTTATMRQPEDALNVARGYSIARHPDAVSPMRAQLKYGGQVYDQDNNVMTSDQFATVRLGATTTMFGQTVNPNAPNQHGTLGDRINERIAKRAVVPAPAAPRPRPVSAAAAATIRAAQAYADDAKQGESGATLLSIDVSPGATIHLPQAGQSAPINEVVIEVEQRAAPAIRTHLPSLEKYPIDKSAGQATLSALFLSSRAQADFALLLREHIALSAAVAKAKSDLANQEDFTLQAAERLANPGNLQSATRAVIGATLTALDVRSSPEEQDLLMDKCLAIKARYGSIIPTSGTGSATPANQLASTSPLFNKTEGLKRSVETHFIAQLLLPSCPRALAKIQARQEPAKTRETNVSVASSSINVSVSSSESPLTKETIKKAGIVLSCVVEEEVAISRVQAWLADNEVSVKELFRVLDLTNCGVLSIADVESRLSCGLGSKILCGDGTTPLPSPQEVKAWMDRFSRNATVLTLSDLEAVYTPPAVFETPVGQESAGMTLSAAFRVPPSPKRAESTSKDSHQSVASYTPSTTRLSNLVVRPASAVPHAQQPSFNEGFETQRVLANAQHREVPESLKSSVTIVSARAPPQQTNVSVASSSVSHVSHQNSHVGSQVAQMAPSAAVLAQAQLHGATGAGSMLQNSQAGSRLAGSQANVRLAGSQAGGVSVSNVAPSQYSTTAASNQPNIVDVSIHNNAGSFANGATANVQITSSALNGSALNGLSGSYAQGGSQIGGGSIAGSVAQRLAMLGQSQASRQM